MKARTHNITSRTSALVDSDLTSYRIRITTGFFSGRFVIFKRWFVRGLTEQQIARKAFDMLRNEEV